MPHFCLYFDGPQPGGRPHMITMLEEFIRYALEKGAWIAPFCEMLKQVRF